MKTLFMVRHATSRTNIGEHWGDGPATIPLTDFGHAQAQDFSANWKIRPDLIVVSHYTRSIQTATPLAEKYVLPLVTMAVQEFTYWDYQLTTQREYDEIRKSANAFWKRLDPFEKGGGSHAENFVEFVERCKTFRQFVEHEPFANLVCVSHGFFLHAFAALMSDIDLPPSEFMAYLRDTLPGTAYANLQVEKYELA